MNMYMYQAKAGWQLKFDNDCSWYVNAYTRFRVYRSSVQNVTSVVYSTDRSCQMAIVLHVHVPVYQYVQSVRPAGSRETLSRDSSPPGCPAYVSSGRK